MEWLPIEDARNFRTCSRLAEQVASPRALSHQVLRLTPGKRIDHLVSRQPERLSWIRHLVVICDTPDSESTDALLRVLSAARGLRELASDGFESILCTGPRLRDAIASLASLTELTLENTGPETSAWILGGGGHSSGFSSLASLSIDVLDLTHWESNAPVRRLQKLRSLSVRTLHGHLKPLVQFAPRLTSLRVEYVYDTIIPTPAASNLGWTTLTYIAGPVESIHRLRLLFPSVVHTVVFTSNIWTAASALYIEPTLQGLQPCCLEIEGQIAPSLVFPRVARASSQLTYLRFSLSDAFNSLAELDAVSRNFTSLVCLDIVMGSSVIFTEKAYENLLHYIACKIPTLRFLLATWQECIDGEEISSFITVESTNHSMMHEANILWAWSLGRYGLVFSPEKMAMEHWITGRTIATLTNATAERIRRDYRDAMVEERLDVDELFARSVNCTSVASEDAMRSASSPASSGMISSVPGHKLSTRKLALL